MKKIAVLTSGGDAPGMNAAIRSVIRMAGFLHCEIVGIHRGYSGLLEEDFRLLTNRDAGGIVLRGGTMLRTARCPAFFDEDNQKKRRADLKKSRDRRTYRHRRRWFCPGGGGLVQPWHTHCNHTRHHRQ